MSVDLSKLIVKKVINLDDLKDRTVAIDAYNTIYQFLSIIRQPDGTPLADSNGNVTSHLSGLFYRTIELIQHGIKPIYVYDGIPSMLKQKTIEARIQKRNEAYKAWQEAVEKGNVEEAHSYAERSTRINKEIVASSKELLSLMGIGYINAPSEGEAEASYLSMKGLVFSAVSQDYDTLLFGARNIVRNIAISGKRKLPKKNIYINVNTELVNLDETLSSIGISRRQLIWVGIMLGTDFNKGIKGIGPKTAVKIVKQCESLDQVIEYIKSKYKLEFEFDVNEVENLFLNPEVKELSDLDISNLNSLKPDVGGIVDFMCRKHEFSEDRIRRYAELLSKAKGSLNQKGISNWM
ncbi:flap endonuclease 1 [Candidatus Mancarchaeum acidiphilum]|uniref:Flap endonuclease 1 n=1 Tax=Candidatus Mancarchaeum acidiphilum TaxID=1920749 RepID=A0A218NNM1_9ARCH|nr:flap endonuclease-1 [Candidatus Mancarchaeum acidiphilum]ASI14071.1 flap endonuclease 1 [Candidatus Mancarchaeum acidiphilum]